MKQQFQINAYMCHMPKETMEGYIIDDVFGITKFNRSWGVFHIPSGERIAWIKKLNHSKEFCKLLVEHVSLKHWREENVKWAMEQDGIELMPIMTNLAKLRNEYERK